MPIQVDQIPTAIHDGVFRVIRQANPPAWIQFRDQRIEATFDATRDPANWPDFFLEAVAWSVQTELLKKGSYCRRLDQRLKNLRQQDAVWQKFFEVIREHVEGLL